MTAVSVPRLPSWRRPTRIASTIFAAKVAMLRTQRAAQNIVSGPPLLGKADTSGLSYVIAESRTPLWSDETAAERTFQLGKNQNLRVACRALDGLSIPTGKVFSLWRHLGPPIAARGYVSGRMLKQGCIVPSVGGGLCQLSNALYDVALQAGCRIVERHSHSRVVPGSAAAAGRDATVAWNYVDLRFAPNQDLYLSARLDRNSLTVRLLARVNSATRPTLPAEPSPGPASDSSAVRSCVSCDETDCFLHKHGESAGSELTGRHVFLVDEAWPEFQDHVNATRQPGDWLGLPLDGVGLRLARYAWRVDGFGRTVSAPIATLRRALALRSAGLQGATRRGVDLAGTRRIAASLARLLTSDVTAVTIAQSYLPFLWRSGDLGGRQVSVLMTRLPMMVLQARLDAAAEAHPERATLTDFRAPARLAEAEAEALAEAAYIITPHAEIAALFGDRTVRVPWRVPSVPPLAPVAGSRIAFLGPTVARKGAHVVRDAAMALGLEVMPLGAELEGPDFWHGVRTVTVGNWDRVAAVVQPALVEDQPRRLLTALAGGIPVIATPACGLDSQQGLVLISADNPTALIEALTVCLRNQERSASASSGWC
jgi:hypothetical protein